MLLSATSKKGNSAADLHPVQNPVHSSVNSKQEEQPTCWLTYCLTPSACFSQQQEKISQTLTNLLFKSFCQQEAGRASQILTYMLLKPQHKFLSVTGIDTLFSSKLTNYLPSLRVCHHQHQNDEFKQNINLHSFYDERTILSICSWDQLELAYFLFKYIIPFYSWTVK